MMSEDDDLDVKLTDFNLSKLLLGKDYTTTVLGTMGYCAPEVISHKPYTYSVDIWSLGVLLYIILVGFPPFPLGKDPMAPIKTKQGKFSFPKAHWDHISEDAKDLIRKMLVLEPQDRISLEDMETHSWFIRFTPPKTNRETNSTTSPGAAGLFGAAPAPEVSIDPDTIAIRQKLEEILSLDSLCTKVAELGGDVPRETVGKLAKEVWDELCTREAV